MAKSTTKKAPKAAKAPKVAKAPKAAATEGGEASTETQAAPATAFKYEVFSADTPKPAPRRRTTGGGSSPYPFSILEVGQFIKVPTELDADLYTNDEEFGKAVVEDLRTIANRLSGAVRRFTKANEGKKFKVYTADDCVVVERIEAA